MMDAVYVYTHLGTWRYHLSINNERLLVVGFRKLAPKSSGDRRCDSHGFINASAKIDAA